MRGLSDITGFDPVTASTFTVNASLPFPRMFSAAAYAGNTGGIYIFGGTGYVDATCNSGINNMDQVVEFNPQTSSMTVLSARVPPTWDSDRINGSGNGRTAMPGVYEPDEGMIYLFGGSTKDITLISSTTVAFNPKSRDFSALNIPPVPTVGVGGAGIYAPPTHSIYYIGGYIRGSYGSNVYSSAITRFRFYGLYPPSGLNLSLAGGSRARLDWQLSPSTDVAQYNVYWDSGTSVIDYDVKLATVAADMTGFTTGPLVSSVTYTFGVRAQALNGAEEQNTNVAASIFVPPSSSAGGASAAIKLPPAGKKINGDRVTVMASIGGDTWLVSGVTFQYRLYGSSTTAWADIPAAEAGHPNPDDSYPYFIHWDVTGLAEGDYELRALAMDAGGGTEDTSASVVVTVDHSVPDIEEDAVGQSVRNTGTVYNTIPQTIESGSGTGESTVSVALPAGAVAAASTTVSVVGEPAGLPPAPGLDYAGASAQVSLGSGQTALNGAATVKFGYKDANGDLYIDGTGIRADRCGIYAYDAAAGAWKKESASYLDAGSREISAATWHFSLFGLFAPAYTGLSGIEVYPVPWEPDDGDADNGKPYVSGDMTSGIIFDNLPQSVKIEIYTMSGGLVWKESVDGSGGKVQWDGRNGGGRKAASGGYLAVITDKATGKKAVKKLAIIR